MSHENSAFHQFCHLAARRSQFLARAIHKSLTGQRMTDESSDSNPLQEVFWMEMRMIEIYRASSSQLRRQMVAAEARFRNCSIKKARLILSDLLKLLAEFESKRQTTGSSRDRTTDSGSRDGSQNEGKGAAALSSKSESSSPSMRSLPKKRNA